MARALVCAVVVLGLCVGGVLAADAKDKKDSKDKKASKPFEAKVVKTDPKKGTVTLKWKKKDGKEVEKTFTLTEDIRYMDSTGKVAAIDVFQAGNDVLVVEREGKISEMKKQDKKSTKTAPKPEKK